jgi:hypothetical protein
MAITKANILTFVNDQLSRSETDIDNQIVSVINDLRFLDVLEAQDTDQTLSDGSTYFEEPTGFKSPISIVLNDGSYDLEPLLPMPGGYKGYKAEMENFTTGDESEPKYYARFNGKIYVFPTADQDYTITLDFYKKHALTPDSISFDDDFTNCLKFGATYYTALKYGLTRYIAIWQPVYRNEIQTLILANPGQPRFAGGK